MILLLPVLLSFCCAGRDPNTLPSTSHIALLRGQADLCTPGTQCDSVHALESARSQAALSSLQQQLQQQQQPVLRALATPVIHGGGGDVCRQTPLSDVVVIEEAVTVQLTRIGVSGFVTPANSCSMHDRLIASAPLLQLLLNLV